MAAAMPPSAITVCALPSKDLQIKPTETPLPAASIAARRPAPPAPMTRTSYENEFDAATVRRSSRHDGRQTAPREQHVAPVQAADAGVGEVAGRRLRDFVEASAHDVPDHMTAPG